MSTLYLRLPAKSAADRLDDLRQAYCLYALASDTGAIEREGEAALSDLAPLMATVARVTLLLAASDVSLLRIRVPALSPARLRAALPNLLEEKLMSDPAECVLVAGASVDGMRTVAVVQRDWLEQLRRTITALGGRSISALPSQLCIPQQDDIVSAAIAEHSMELDVCIRLTATEGVGIAMLPEHADSAPQEAIETLCAMVPQLPIALYVPQASVPAYRAVLEKALLHERISLFADNWQRWVSSARTAGIDLMHGLGIAGSGGLNWRPWRWAIGLASALLLLNIIALNIDWLRMKREANALQNSMILTYKTAFPKETAIIDPIVQIRQKIAAAQRAAGQTAPDDFTALLANFGQAWSSVMQGSQSLLIAAIEYHDRSLLVKLKPEATPPLEQIKAALAQRQLTLSQQNAGVWQIRSSK